MTNRNRDWFIVGGLLLLGLIPLIGGAVRVSKVVEGDNSLDNARFMASPLLILSHIFASTLFSVLGAFQFAPNLRIQFQKWHRRSGAVLVLAGLLVAVSGIWMTMAYPPANHDGRVVYAARLIVGSLMAGYIIMAVNAIRRREFGIHGIWMIRAYALAMGAGTQVLTHIPYFFFQSMQGESARAASMAFGWLINAAVAEWIIYKKGEAHAFAKI